MQKTTSKYSKTFQATTGFDFESIKYLQILKDEGKISDGEVRHIYRILTKAKGYIDNAFEIQSVGFQEYVFRKVMTDMYDFVNRYTFTHPDVNTLLKNIIVTYKRSKFEKLNKKKNMKKSSVCGIIVNEHILLLKRAYREGKSNGWCLPGGKVEPGESSLAGGIRETLEETGIVIDTPKYVGKEVSASADFIVKVYYTIMDEMLPVTLSPREHTEYAWVAFEDLSNYELAGNTGKFMDLIFADLEK